MCIRITVHTGHFGCAPPPSLRSWIRHCSSTGEVSITIKQLNIIDCYTLQKQSRHIMSYRDKTSCLRKQWNCTNRIETCLYDILYCPPLAVLTQPDLSSGTTTNRSTHHKQTTLVTGSCTVNGIDQSYTA